MRKLIVVATLALGMFAAGCGNDDADSSDPAAGNEDGSGSDQEPVEPFEGPADKEHVILALEALADPFPEAKDCDSTEPPTIYEASGHPTAASWWGETASGVRADAVWDADFCLPDGPNHEHTEIDLDVVGFESHQEAADWLDELSSAISGGQQVTRPDEASSSPGCDKTARLLRGSVAGADAVDVEIEDPCGIDRDFPDYDLEYEPELYSYAAIGPYVFSISAQQTSGEITELRSDQMTMTGSFPTKSVVLRDQHGAAFDAIAEALGVTR